MIHLDGRKFFPMRPLPIWPNTPSFEKYMDDPAWIAEPKRNGFRVIVTRDSIFTRHGVDVTRSVKNEKTWKLLKSLPVNTILDGELLGDEKNRAAVYATGHLVLFDVIRWGSDLMIGTPYEERKEILTRLPGKVGLFGETTRKGKDRLWGEAKEGLSEGLVFKRSGSLYRLANRENEESPDWIKTRVNMTKS